jgi:hypothetical protein
MPAILAFITMLAGLFGFYAILDLLSPHYSGLPQKTTPYLFLLFWLPLVTIHNSRFPSWPTAAVVVSLAVLAFAVGAIAVLLGGLAGPDTGLAIFAGIAAAFAISVGTIVVSRRRWPRADPIPNVSRATTRREIFFIWVAIFGRFAAFVALTAAIAVVASMPTIDQIDCACGAIPLALTSAFPAALIALKRGGGRKEWVIIILAGLLVYVINMAGLIIASWVFYLWDLRGNLMMGLAVMIGAFFPGVVVWTLMLVRSDRLAQAAKEEPSGRRPAPGA